MDPWQLQVSLIPQDLHLPTQVKVWVLSELVCLDLKWLVIDEATCPFGSWLSSQVLEEVPPLPLQHCLQLLLDFLDQF